MGAEVRDAVVGEVGTGREALVAPAGPVELALDLGLRPPAPGEELPRVGGRELAAALIDDPVALFLELDEHGVEGVRSAVAARSNLLLVRRMLRGAPGEQGRGRVVVDVADRRRAVLVGNHPSRQHALERGALLHIEEVLGLVALEHELGGTHGFSFLWKLERRIPSSP